MRPCQQQFTLVNRGRRLQALSWTTQGFSAAKLKKMEIKRATRDMKDVRLKVGCLFAASKVPHVIYHTHIIDYGEYRN